MSQEQVLKLAADYVQLTNQLADQLYPQCQQLDKCRQKVSEDLASIVLKQAASGIYLAFAGRSVCFLVNSDKTIQKFRGVVTSTPSILSTELSHTLQQYAELDEILDDVMNKIKVTTDARNAALKELREHFRFDDSDRYVILLGNTAVLLFDSTTYIVPGCVVASAG